MFHKLDLIVFKSALIPLLSPQWDRAQVLPPNTVRAGDAHQGLWAESVHLTEARAGSGLPEQNPRLLQLPLHLLSRTSLSRRSRGTQTRKLSQRKKKTFCFLCHTLEWWHHCSDDGHRLLDEDGNSGFLFKAETKTEYFCLFKYGLYQFCSQVSMFRMMASESTKFQTGRAQKVTDICPVQSEGF